MTLGELQSQGSGTPGVHGPPLPDLSIITFSFGENGQEGKKDPGAAENSAPFPAGLKVTDVPATLVA